MVTLLPFPRPNAIIFSVDALLSAASIPTDTRPWEWSWWLCKTNCSVLQCDFLYFTVSGCRYDLHVCLIKLRIQE